ncbi:hypothetical protein Tco_0358932 [Tanacetum coccineum]
MRGTRNGMGLIGEIIGMRKRFRQTWLLGILDSEKCRLQEYELGLLGTELGKESHITDKSKKGVGDNAVPSPHPLILNRPITLDLSYSGLEEFKEPEENTQIEKPVKRTVRYADKSLVKEQESQVKSSFVKGCGSNTSKNVSEVEPKKVRKNNDAPIIEDWVSDDEEQDGSKTKPEKKTVIPTAAKIEKPVRKPVKYAEMYRSQRPRGNQRNWNGQKSNQLGCNFVFNNKACFICGSFDHIQYSCPNQQRKRIVSGNNYNKKDNDYYSKTSHPSAHKHMAPRAVLMKTGLKSFNTARPVNTVRSVNTGRPFSTARSFNTVRPFYTAHPKSTIHCARPRTYFQNQAQSTVHRPFYKRTTLTKRCFNQRFNTGRPFRSTVNTVRARGFNAVKPSACWVWRPIKPNGASLVFNKYNYIDAQGRSKNGHKVAVDLDSLNLTMNYATSGWQEHFSHDVYSKQGVSESCTSSSQDHGLIIEKAILEGGPRPMQSKDTQVEVPRELKWGTIHNLMQHVEAMQSDFFIQTATGSGFSVIYLKGQKAIGKSGRSRKQERRRGGLSVRNRSKTYGLQRGKIYQTIIHQRQMEYLACSIIYVDETLSLRILQRRRYVQPKKKGIFNSQYNMVHAILEKVTYYKYVKSASYSNRFVEKPFGIKMERLAEVDETSDRSMIGSLVYLTHSRKPDIMFADVAKCKVAGFSKRHPIFQAVNENF